MTRVRVLGMARVFFVGLASMLLLAAPAHAEPVTLNFSGTVDLSVAGLPANTVFSGFFTWESTATPFESNPDPFNPTADGDAVYDVTAYQMLVNGVDITLPIVGHGNGNGMQVINNVDALQAGEFVDALVFFGGSPILGPNGNNIIFAGALVGPNSMFGSTNLPANLDFLPLTTGQSFWFEEVSGDQPDTLLGSGSFVASAPASVPEPATLSLTAIGLAGMVATRRRRRSSQLG